jgi:hypothetical protein
VDGCALQGRPWDRRKSDGMAAGVCGGGHQGWRSAADHCGFPVPMRNSSARKEAVSVWPSLGLMLPVQSACRG